MDGSLTSPASRPARVLLVDEDGLFRANLRRLLDAPPSVLGDVYGIDLVPGFEVVGEAATGDEAVPLARRTEADLLIMGLGLVALPGLQAVAEITVDGHAPRIILLSVEITRPEIADAIRLGVRGLVLKNAPAQLLLQAIRWVLEGRCWIDHALITDLLETARPLIQSSPETARLGGARLTRREREVLGLILAGYANKEIARVSSVTEDSIKHHLTRMYEKLGVSNRVELATFATAHHLLDS